MHDQKAIGNIQIVLTFFLAMLVRCVAVQVDDKPELQDLLGKSVSVHLVKTSAAAGTVGVAAAAAAGPSMRPQDTIEVECSAGNKLVFTLIGN